MPNQPSSPNTQNQNRYEQEPTRANREQRDSNKTDMNNRSQNTNAPKETAEDEDDAA